MKELPFEIPDPPDEVSLVRALRFRLYEALEVLERDALDSVWAGASPDELAAEIRHAVKRLELWDFGPLEPLHAAFLPTGDWDDIVGAREMDLPGEIAELIDLLRAR